MPLSFSRLSSVSHDFSPPLYYYYCYYHYIVIVIGGLPPTCRWQPNRFCICSPFAFQSCLRDCKKISPCVTLEQIRGARTPPPPSKQARGVLRYQCVRGHRVGSVDRVSSRPTDHFEVIIYIITCIVCKRAMSL